MEQRQKKKKRRIEILPSQRFFAVGATIITSNLIYASLDLGLLLDS